MIQTIVHVDTNKLQLKYGIRKHVYNYLHLMSVALTSLNCLTKSDILHKYSPLFTIKQEIPTYHLFICA